MSLQELIGVLKEEYLRHQVCTAQADSINLATQQKPSLAKHMGIDNDDQLLSCTKSCNNCPRKPCIHHGKDNHINDKCELLGKPKCSICNKFSHSARDCWNKPEKKRSENDNVTASTSNGNKKQKMEEMHVVIEGTRIEEVEDEIVFNIEEKLWSVGDNDEEIVTACIGNGKNESVCGTTGWQIVVLISDLSALSGSKWT